MEEEQQHHAFIQQFCNVTASSPQQARFFLESSSWQLEPALQHFFEASDSGLGMGLDVMEQQHEEEEAADQHHSSQPNQPSRPPPSGPFQGVGAFPRSTNPSSSSSGGRKPAKNKQQSSGSRGGIRTLSDLSSPPADSDSDSDGPVEYYTGGEKSGMLVQDPSKGHKDVDAIFDRARQMGAQEGPLEPPQAPSSSRTAFTGTGRTLAGDIQQPQVEGARSRPQLDPVVRSITFWRNGFTVDDGPLRRLDDPANAQFLASISKSECPKELEPTDHGTPVHVNLIRKDEDWQPPLEPKVVPFRGVGRTLGSSSARDAGSASSPSVASNQPSTGLVVDNSNPVTSIQLRLSDGTRLVARFNHYHTVADIRGFIDAARPGNMRNYQLQTMGFPPKALTDLTETIEQAGLINAVVIQKT